MPWSEAGTAVEYFGTADPIRQWDAIAGLSEASRKFALYVYIKAVYVFYRDEIGKKDIRTLIGRILKKYETQKDGHPWEFILKYCALLWVYKVTPGGDEESDGMMRKAENAVEKIGIQKRILSESAAQYARAKQGIFEPMDGQLTYMYR